MSAVLCDVMMALIPSAVSEVPMFASLPAEAIQAVLRYHAFVQQHSGTHTQPVGPCPVWYKYVYGGDMPKQLQH